MGFLPIRPGKLGPGRTITTPLQLRGNTAIIAVLSQGGLDFEAHANDSSSECPQPRILILTNLTQYRRPRQDGTRARDVIQ